jgi:hypothetical protein
MNPGWIGMPPQAGAALGAAAGQAFPQDIAAALQQPVALQVAINTTRSALEGAGYTVLGMSTQFAANPQVQVAAQQACADVGHGYAVLAASGQPVQFVCVAPVFDALTGFVHDHKYSQVFSV